MKITVIATGFDKESADSGSATSNAALPPTPARYTQRPGDDMARPAINSARPDDLDVPTFIRKKAD